MLEIISVIETVNQMDVHNVVVQLSKVYVFAKLSNRDTTSIFVIVDPNSSKTALADNGTIQVNPGKNARRMAQRRSIYRKHIKIYR